MKKLYYFLFFSLFFTIETWASHILGGEIYYDHLGSGNYRITLKIYRDCISLANFDGLPPFDNSFAYTDAVLTVFDGSGNFVKKVLLDPPDVNFIPPTINNPCITSTDPVCMEEGVYTKTVNLTPQQGGYYIVYQRCCRSAATLNLLNPSSQGSSYLTRIPGPEMAAINSSPRFSNLPPAYICNGMQIGYNHSAVDPDGDVLVYSLTSPFAGPDNCCGHIPYSTWSPSVTLNSCPSSTCPLFNSPPYSPLPFLAPYSGSYPISSSPAININPATGMLNGIPNLNGNWAFCVQVSEYRNNILIGVHYRDYMITVINCIVQVKSIVKAQGQTKDELCGGSTITFTNQSYGGNTWHWDFGVNSLSNDTSNLLNPTYTYPDTGKYQVTLIANPGKPCADTSKQTICIYPPLAPTFTAPPAQCITNNNFNFTVGGIYASYAAFNWNFGSGAAPPLSTVPSPSNVVYNQPGKFPVRVIVKQRVCSDTLTDTVKVYPKPIVAFDSVVYTECDPAVISFTNLADPTYPTIYHWSFSNGVMSAIKDPTVTFSPPGSYSATLTTITNNGCVDTNRIILPGFVTINPSPVAGYSYNPTETTIFEPDIHFTDQSQNAISWHYDFGDGQSSDSASLWHHYEIYGEFPVVQTVANQFGCKNSVTHIVKINPEFRFWVPNSFTPDNQDGLNDLFLPITFGVENYNFSIYDRWGNRIFETTDTNTGWDGTFKGETCERGVYSYLVTFLNVVTKRREQHYGHVTLFK